MADFATALSTRLKAAVGVSAAAGGRVYWRAAPQGTQMPYIVLTTISDPRPTHLDGYQDARPTRVQVDCMAARYGDARQMAEAVIAAVTEPAIVGGVRFGFGKAEGPRDLGEDVEGEGFVHRASVDLLLEHTTA